MLFVDAYGGTKAQQDLAIELAYFAIEQLNPRLQNVDIEINIGKHTSQGGCIRLGEREFEIEVDKDLTGDDFATCVFHEMVHVSQYIKKNMYERDGNTFWCGTIHTNTPYFDKPWEVEAYRLQEELLVTLQTVGRQKVTNNSYFFDYLYKQIE